VPHLARDVTRCWHSELPVAQPDAPPTCVQPGAMARAGHGRRGPSKLLLQWV